jgi:hypothetical protein
VGGVIVFVSIMAYNVITTKLEKEADRNREGET